MKYMGNEEKKLMIRADPGTVILLKAPVGSGKTTFCLKELWTHCRLTKKHLLLIVNRAALRGQLVTEILEILSVDRGMSLEEKGILQVDNLTMVSYQYLQTVFAKNVCIPAQKRIGTHRGEEFDFVFSDEIHYLYSDSLFSPATTYLSGFPAAFPRAVRIYASATLEPVRRTIFELEQILDLEENLDDFDKKYLKIRYIDMGSRSLMAKNFFERRREVLEIDTVKQDFSYLNPVIFEESQDVFELIAERIKEGSKGKWLVFVDSKDEGRRIKSQLKKRNVKAAFVAADGNEEEDEYELSQIIQHQKFSVEVLLATPVIYNGITIVDRKVENIVISGFEKIQAIQQVGRLRIKNRAQRVNLFICRHSAAYYNGKRFYLEIRRKAYEIFNSGNDCKIEEYLITYGNEALQGIVYKGEDGKMHVNPFAKNALDYYLDELSDNIRLISNGTDLLIQKVLGWFDLEYNPLEDMLRKQQADAAKQLDLFLKGCNGHEQDWDVFRKELRRLYEASCTERLCSERSERLPGLGVVRRIVEGYGYTITGKSEGYLLMKKERENVVSDLQ